jgi:arabinose-5-phosphate isomerase
VTEIAPLDVAGIGSMVVDRLYRIPRILHADEKGILRSFEDGARCRTYVGGVVLNHLGWAAALGVRAGIFGKQADDENGRFLRAAMDALGIERHLTLDGSASSSAELFVDDAGGRAIYMAPGATSETTPDDIYRCHADFIRRARWVTTEVSQLPLATALAVTEIARAAGIPVLLDLDVPPSDAVPGLGDEATLRKLLASATLLKPSKAAARELVPRAADDALELARSVRAAVRVPTVIVTDGEAGCAIVAEGFEGWIPARAVKVVDTTGAGDAFLGGLLAALRLGLAWPEAGKLANACGAACVEKLGAFPDDPAAARARVLELWDGPPLALLGPTRAPTPTHAQTPRAADPTRAQTPRAVDPTRAQDVGVHGSLDGAEGLSILEVASEELARLHARSDASTYERAARLIRESESKGGRVHVTGVGKAGHVARYGAALLASTGTPANFYDANESVHGSSGQIVRGDVVIAVSSSGETEELHAAIDVARTLGGRVVAVTGNPASYLARQAEVVLDAGVAREGGSLGLAPRASVAAQSMVLAALAAVLEHGRSFTRADFHARHPAGTLGKKTREPGR